VTVPLYRKDETYEVPNEYSFMGSELLIAAFKRKPPEVVTTN